MINRGSEWRRWNLHLHSKYSLESRTKMEVAEIFEGAAKNGISMISITDHSNVDALDEIWEVYENGSCELGNYKDLVDFLPGIELKTDKGKHGVHLISIFPKKIKIGTTNKKTTKKLLYDEFCTKLDLTTSNIEYRGKDKYSDGLLCTPVNFKLAIKLTHELGGIVIIHGGDKHGSIENEMEHTHKKCPTPEEMYENLDITKEEIISEQIDVVELPNYRQREAKNAKFYMECMGLPCMIASDSHERDEYESMAEKSTWVKADTTFQGLLQALIDYDNRICLSEIPEQLQRIKLNSTKYIDELIVDWDENYSGSKGIWFKNINIPLNPGLVSIIGNKGNGKTALAEMIAWISDSKNCNKFAFLTNKKFQKNRLANNFICKIKWYGSDEYITRNLGQEPVLSNIERVQCIPQQYFEDVCTDTELEKFTSEINGVIFSRLSKEENEEEESLEALIEKYSKVGENNISYYKNELSNINRQIIDLEKKMIAPYEEKQKALLSDAENQLNAHLKICPKVVAKPHLTEEMQEKYDNVSSDIESIKQRIEIAEKEIIELTKQSSSLQLSLTEITEYKNRMELEKSKIGESIQAYGIDVNSIIQINIDVSPIKSKKKEIDDLLLSKRKVIGDTTAGLRKDANDKEELKNAILSEEDKNIQAYDKYVIEKQIWDEAKKNKEKVISEVKREIDYIHNGVQNDLNPLYEKRNNISSSIYEEKKKIIEVYNRFKKPVDDFLKENGDLLNDYSINIRAGVVLDESFQNSLFDFINKQKKNVFRDDEYQLNKTIVELNELEQMDDYAKIPELIMTCMRVYSVDIAMQLKDKKHLEFYNFLYGMDYIKNKYELISDNKTLDKLSPGERGSLLLIFYLLLDMRDIPLIIDQPEDNLDNQSVAKVLVPFIKAAKKRRQIILVTHNPNLAVVADSDQIIHVKIDKEHEHEVIVRSGGIENDSINESIVTILEGTMDSFRRRDEKYII